MAEPIMLLIAMGSGTIQVCFIRGKSSDVWKMEFPINWVMLCNAMGSFVVDHRHLGS